MKEWLIIVTFMVTDIASVAYGNLSPFDFQVKKMDFSRWLRNNFEGYCEQKKKENYFVHTNSIQG
jgi:hypothetical protein